MKLKRSLILVIAFSFFALVGGANCALAKTFVYITNSVSKDVTVVDAVTNGPIAEVPVAGSPHGIAVTPDGTRVYVAFQGGPSNFPGVSVIDASTNKIVANIIFPTDLGADPWGVAITPDGTRAYVTDRTGRVWVIDTGTNSVVATLTGFGSPTGIAITPDGARAYVADPTTGFHQNGFVWVIDTGTNSVSTVNLGFGIAPLAVAITPDGALAYVATSDGSVAEIDTATNSVVRTVPGVGIAPAAVAFTPDGTRAYVAGSGTVSVIDTATNSVVATLTVAFLSPNGIAITPDGARAYLPQGNFFINVIDIATNHLHSIGPLAGRGRFGVAITPAPAVAFPDTTITSGPAGLTRSTSATFTFSATDPDATFACQLDAGGFVACTSPITYSNLSEGNHTFQVRATAAGGTDPTPAQFSWTIDLTAPTAIIDSMPLDPTNQTTATFAFHASELSSTLQCSLDGAQFADCSSPKVYGSLLNGQRTFSVQAIDAAGNQGASSSFTWTVDTQAPDTVIDTTPSEFTNSNTATFAFHATEGSSFTCQRDDGPAEACTSPVTYFGLALGQHIFGVVATDAAGNVDPTPVHFAWVIDTTTPDTTITSGPVAGSTITSTSATFEFAGTDDVSQPADLRFECDLDGAGFSVCTSPVRYSGLSRRTHTFSVRAMDQAGNIDPSPASVTWTIDKITPVVTWVNPADITYPTALGATQLNATADVPGTFAYTPGSGSLLNAGGGQSLQVVFTPNDTPNYKTVSKTVSINVLKGKATLTLTGLGSFVYDGTPKVATATTKPSGLTTVTVAYNEITAAPSAVGTYTVVATLNNPNYQADSVSGSLSIQAWTLAGFYQPVDMSTPTTVVWNTVKAGSTVPLKFEIFAGAVERTDTAAVTRLTATAVGCSSGLDDAVDDLAATGGTSLRYDSTAGQFIYNWQTPKQTGQCYLVKVATADGGSIDVYFKLK